MYSSTIGLEIHIQLKTASKMFCGSPNNPDEKEPNINICPVCTGQPGVLPVINEKAVEQVILTGLALECEIPEFSKFDRKNYFYPDLPKGYQISQYDAPLCKDGNLEIENKKIRIRRIHLEEDTGKLIHSEDKSVSLIDFNRAGVPLMELVTEPDIETGQEAKRFCEELQLILRYLGVSSADMEKGEMRCEVNVSLMPTNSAQISQINKKISDISGKIRDNSRKLGTKVEIKNLNSFKAVEKAIDYEIQRQSRLLKSKEKIIQETRGWNEKKQATISQRVKEEAQDYRYFPEPDLPLLTFVREEIDKVKIELPELPEARKDRFRREYNIPGKDIEILVTNKDLGEYFESIVSEIREWLKEGADKELALPKSRAPETKGIIIQEKLYKLAANYLITELQKLLIENNKTIKDLKITPEDFAEFIILTYRGIISSSGAQRTLKEMFETGVDPSRVVSEKGFGQVSDEAELEKIVEKVLKENTGSAADYKKGKQQALQFLIGQIMKESKGKANPEIARGLLIENLK